MFGRPRFTQPPPAKFRDDCSQFFKVQWEQHNQFPSDRSNDETIKREINANYANVCDEVKQWIFQDVKKHQAVNQEEETLDVSLLNLLDMDIKFEIIEFIPTYSKWNEFRREEAYLGGIEFPHRVDREFRMSHRVDTSLVTFHKMRVLCKRFNRVMMHKILNAKQLIIPKKVENFAYMATFLRMQRIYKENNCKLDLESLFLYDDVKLIQEEIEKHRNTKSHVNPFGMVIPPPRALFGTTFDASSADANTEDADGETTEDDESNLQSSEPQTSVDTSSSLFGQPVVSSTPFVFAPAVGTSSTSTGFGTRVFAGETTEDDEDESDLKSSEQQTSLFGSARTLILTPTFPTTKTATGFTIGEDYDTDSSSPSPRNISSSSVFIPTTPPTQSTPLPSGFTQQYDLFSQFEDLSKGASTIQHPHDRLSAVPVVHEAQGSFCSPSLSGIDLSSLIGENTTIERLIVFHEDCGRELIKCLVNLKQLDFGCPYRVVAGDDFSHLEEITSLADALDYTSSKVKITSYNEPMRVGFFSFGSTKGDPKNCRPRLKILEYLKKLDRGTLLLFLQEYSGPTTVFGGNSTNIFYNVMQYAKNTEEMEMGKALLEFCFSVNYPIEISSFSPTFMAAYSQALFQYIIYLTNEYQGGRLHIVPNGRLSIYSILFGWHFWKQTNELIHISANNEDMCPLVYSHFSDLLTKEMAFSVLVHMMQDNGLNRTLGALLENKAESVYEIVTKIVPCSQKLHIPLLGMLLTRVNYGGYLLERIINALSAETVANLPKTEHGDNILHFLLNREASMVSPSLVIQIMKKAPHMVHEKNEDGESPYELINAQFDPYMARTICKEGLN